MSVDSSFDLLLSWMYSKTITYSLITWNWITFIVERAIFLSKRTFNGIADAHTPSLWYFTERNGTPWRMKEGWESQLQFDNPMFWRPDENRLVFLENGQMTNKTFSTVVTAELFNSDRSLQFDLSSFFHTFTWQSVSAAPSLYEVILLYCLQNNLLFSKTQLNKLTLEVMTNDNETVRHSLNSYKDFVDWNKEELVELVESMLPKID